MLLLQGPTVEINASCWAGDRTVRSGAQVRTANWALEEDLQGAHNATPNQPRRAHNY